MQQSSNTPSTLIENVQMIPDISQTNDTSYSSILLKKKLAMLENSSSTTMIGQESVHPPVALIKPSSTTLAVNEHEPVKSASRRRKPLRPWSLSARVERPNTTIHINNNNNNGIEPISDNEQDNHSSEGKHSPMSNATINSNLDEDNHCSWPTQLSTIEEILKLYHVETDGTVQCTRCGCHANEDNLLDHVSVHYPHKCYTCGFYCDSSSALDEHNQTHTPNDLSKPSIMEEMPVSPPVPVKSSDSKNTNTTNSEKTTPASKAKVHRCRQCSYVSSVKEEYWAHHRVHIRADKILECPSCPFVTEYKHHLEYHLRNHLGSKPFKCSKCDYACVNLSMLRSHKKSHFRHLLFKCANCSFESKQYHLLQEHLQIEGHQVYLDEHIEEFLKEYSNGNLSTNINSNPPSQTILPVVQKPNTRLPTSRKRKTISNTSRIKRVSSTSSMDSSPDMISPLSTDEHPVDLAYQPTMPFNPSLLASLGQFNPTPGQFNDFLAPYQQFLTQQIQSHLSSSTLPLDNNNNPTSLPTFITAGYSLLSSCLRNDSNEKISPTAKRQRKDPDESEQRTVVDQQTQVDEWQIKRLFECFHCEMIFKDFAMYCTHKQFHHSSDNPFRCAQCGEQTTNKHDFFVHVTQQAHELT